MGGITVDFHVTALGELRLLDSAGDFCGEGKTMEFLLSSTRSGDVFYDVGANFGFYTVLVAKGVGETGQVLSFEPDSSSLTLLQGNLLLNGIRNVRCFRKALGDRTTTAKLYLGQERGSSSLLDSCGVNAGHELVEVVQGDAFVDKEKLPSPNLVKIDVEGYEFAVLNGLASTLACPTCRLVCCEVHPALLPDGVSTETIVDFLESLGFDAVETYTRKGYESLDVIAYKKNVSGRIVPSA